MPEQESGSGTAIADPSAVNGGILGGLAINHAALEVFGEPKTEPKPEETGTKKPENAAPEGVEPAKPVEEVKTDAQPEVTPKKEEVLLAGKFKTADDLAVAYENSSKEGRRLHSELQKQVQLNERLEQELETIKLQAELGSFTELSDEQLKALAASEDPDDRLKLQQYLVDRKFYQEKKTRLEADGKNKSKESVRQQAEMKASIEQSFDRMSNDPKGYPNFKELMPMMDELFERTGRVFEGQKDGPEALYLMSLGIVHLESLKKSSSDTAKAAQEAARTAQAKAKAAGSSGANPTSKVPAVEKEGDFVDQLVGANRNKRFFAV